jgi:radical SAM protein (TIGR01212 family)
MRESPMRTAELKGKIRVRTINEELRERFGCRVHKVPVHAGFTCPNRDGILGTGGCLFCDPHGSAAAWSDPDEGVTAQLRRGMEYARKRFQARKFIAYFQPFSNTYALVSRLKVLWEEALAVDDIVGISVGTRPDCLPEDVLDLIRTYREGTPYFNLEIGLQTVHDKTLREIGRGHDFACFKDAVQRAHRRGIPLCVHIILGLPGETVPEMMETVRTLLDLEIEGIKLHHLHILKGSLLEREYRAGRLSLMTQEEYVSLVCRILELIAGRMVIHRFMGEAPIRRLVAPDWTGRKRDVLAAIARDLGGT